MLSTLRRAGVAAARNNVHRRSQRTEVFQNMPRRTFIMGPIYKFAKGVMPRISATEQAALNSGTVGFDREIFSGNPSLKSLVEKYDVGMTAEELAFMEKEVNTLCEMIDDYQVGLDQNLPPEVWTYIRENGFLGLCISKDYGGKGFSAHAHSVMLQRVATRSIAGAVTVMVPNSLGPAELLREYGTEAQKDHYLPRLAAGVDIPCFALTGPPSGSDAAAMRDVGVVCRDPQTGELGIRATFNKRYITLAPVATLVGLAIDLQDPDGLLGESLAGGTEGITVCLLDKGHPGLETGPRHNPIDAGFMNGTVRGTEVFIPMDAVVGGQSRCGFGWNMLMECLGEGRGISLPASAGGIAQLAVNAVGGYARIRKQFKVPIAEMEGVQEPLARIASTTYTCTAAQALFNAIVGQHERPPILSAIMKLRCTEMGRQAGNDAMDVIGGAGICKGPMNYMATKYQSMPVAITVEGANILTRSLIVFGQGLNRAHPNMQDLIGTIQKGDDLAGFSRHAWALVGHGARNAARSFATALSPARALRRAPDAARGGASADAVRAFHEAQVRIVRSHAISCFLV
jgi:alkylation response protein AidB-like acyl-CoA dehydrogenase